MSNGVKVISLFAGCGGSSLGYKLAGCDIAMAVEHDPHAAQIYRLNNPNTCLFEGDIQTFDPQSIRDICHKERFIILDGSPPCQGFSMAGRRNVDDPRNMLFQEYIRCLEVIKPHAFVMENVPGLVTGKMRPIFRLLINQLEACGYQVRAKILNAAYYGVPQCRKRVIILGIRNDLNLLPLHPTPQTHPISFRIATGFLSAHSEMLIPVGKAMDFARALKAGESGAKLHKRFGHKGSDFSISRVSWDKPCPTVLKSIRAGQSGLLHPDQDRFLSIGELKRVCSFPDDFILHGTFEQQWARLGNAVPPLLMKAIAESLAEQLFSTYERKDNGSKT